MSPATAADLGVWKATASDMALWRATASDAIGAKSLYAGLVLAFGAVGYWRLDDSGGTAADLTGNGHTGTIAGGVTLGVAGAIGDGDAAMLFDGLTGKIDVPFSAQLNPTPAWSVEGWWLETAGQASNCPIMDCRPASSGASAAGFDLFLGATQVGISVCSTNVNQTILQWLPGATLTNVMHHTIATYDGTQARLYGDGVLRAGPTTCPYTPNSTKPLGIGHLTTGANFCAARLDDLSIYPLALSAAQVANLYIAGLSKMGSLATARDFAV